MNHTVVSRLHPNSRPISGVKRIARLELYVLGSFLISLDGQPINGFRSDKERALLIYLVMENDRPHRRDALAGLLWSETDNRTARNNLRLALHRLRQALSDTDGESALVKVDRETVWIKPQDCWCDASLFSRLITQKGEHRQDRLEDCLICRQRQARAVDLYRGDFLEGFVPVDSPGFIEWTVLRREALHSQIMRTLYGLAEYELQNGENRQALIYAMGQLALEPWLEEAHRQAMRAYARDGRLTSALTQYKECRRTLAGELGVEPAGETLDLYERIQAARFKHLHNLPPQTTPFVGRRGELARLDTMLANPACRLLTIVGPGGIGKTRLAVQAAGFQIRKFLHGVCFVALAEITSVPFLSTSIAAALELTSYDKSDPNALLISYFRKKELLLVLDGFEQLMDGAGLIAEILAMAPELKILVTSQERLNLPGEWVFELHGLPFPASRMATGNDNNFESIDLFVQVAERAGMVNRGERAWPSEDDRILISQICRLVEGVPLAIELAAAWTRLLPLDTIAGGIAKNLDFLVSSRPGLPSRHHSIRSAFDYSWNLLTEEQRKAFSRLAIFRGRFSESMASAITGASPTLLGELVDKSLVRWNAFNEYVIHELLRQYALEQLNASPMDAAWIQRLHCSYYMDFLYKKRDDLFGTKQSAAMKEILETFEDVRAAWKWAVEHGCYLEIKKSILSLSRFYENRSWFNEGAEAMGLAVESLEAGEDDPLRGSLLGRALAFCGWFTFRLHQYDRACDLLNRSLKYLSHRDSPVYRAIALSFLGNVTYWQEDYGKAQEYFEDSLVLFRSEGIPWGTAFALICLSNLAFDRNCYLQAKMFAEEGQTIYRELGDPRAISFSSISLARVYQALANYNRARQLYRDCLDIFIEIKDRWAQALAYNGLGVAALVLGKFDEAEENLQAGQMIFNEVDDPWGRATSLTYLGSLAQARGQCREAQLILREALEIHRNIQYQGGAALALINLAQCSQTLGEFDKAENLAREALSIFRGVDDSRGIAHCMAVLGELAERQGNFADANELYEISLKIFQEIRHRWGVAYAHLCMGRLAYNNKAPTEALPNLLSSLSTFWEIGALPYLFECLVWLARIKHEQDGIGREVLILNCVLAQPAILESTRKEAMSFLQAFPKVALYHKSLDELVTELISEL